MYNIMNGVARMNGTFALLIILSVQGLLMIKLIGTQFRINNTKYVFTQNSYLRNSLTQDVIMSTDRWI